MADEQDPPVGYKSPPRHSQFRKGGPQPQRQPRNGTVIDAYALLSKPLKVGEGRGAKKVHCFEVSLQQLCAAAMKGDMRAAKNVLGYFNKYGAICNGVDEEHTSRIDVPVDCSRAWWEEQYKLLGPPPWPLEHDGVCRLEELRDANKR